MNELWSVSGVFLLCSWNHCDRRAFHGAFDDPSLHSRGHRGRRYGELAPPTGAQVALEQIRLVMRPPEIAVGHPCNDASRLYVPLWLGPFTSLLRI